jgi:hypothetical protein
MSDSTTTAGSTSGNFGWSLLDLLAVTRTIGDLKKSGQSATLVRLFESKHVRDLKLIAGMAIWLIILGMIIIAGGFVYDMTHSHEHATSTTLNQTGINPEAIGKLATTLGALVGVGSLVVAWVYRTASIRLGVVDLFASEITTLCRVGTVVGMAERSIAAFNYTPTGESAEVLTGDHYVPHRFVSEENYFPVFANNSRDLEVLEANVVINVAAFYTYMKVLRDYLRSVGEIQPGKDPEATANWKQTWRYAIYMELLAYEAARHAIADLVEYEPHNAEYTITVLMTEVLVYRFLLDQFRDDYHHGRLLLRFTEYEKTASALYVDLSNSNGDPTWQKAIELWSPLVKRLRDNLGIEAMELPSKPRAALTDLPHIPRPL